ncbi:universal stress protein [Embleya scabrispora]|uniref:universal stress protein n=1 Tax=Embleya scabrispora TaxID=159449 RepID=UPI00035E53C4|nr:universal stress protein [Embleya scabrispora]MYS80678.1 universal stress protein [Streptomyces sp. SID5474]
MSSGIHLPDLGVLVGYDGSPGGERALAWGARAAAEAKAPLYLAMAIPAGTLAHLGRHAHSAEVREGARALLEQAADRCRVAHPYLAVETSLVEGPAADVLLEASRRAELIVVGTRGHGGFAGLLLGSVSLRVCAHTTCPVVVVPEAADDADTASVVVGVADHSDTPAVEFAVERARRIGGRVVPVHVWTLTMAGYFPGVVAPLLGDPLDMAASHDHLLAEILDPIRAQAPDVPIEAIVTTGTPAHALIGVSAHAGLLVVAAHRAHGPFPMRLGPTTHAVLHHASCPVAVVPIPTATP